MVVKKLLLIVSIIVLASSCTPGFFDTLNRTADDPFIEIPTVSSFLGPYTVVVSWSNDEAADEYILEKAEDSPSPIYEIVYRGSATRYQDFKLFDENRYLYRLSKRRGQKTFPVSPPALGIRDVTTRDVHEPNNTAEAATELSYIALSANLPFFRSYNGSEVSDIDIYYVDIPPQWRASIIILDGKPIASGTKTHFNISVMNMPPTTVDQDTAIPIPNYETFAVRCYFAIYPAQNEYLDTMGGFYGGSVVDYTIRVSDLAPM